MMKLQKFNSINVIPFIDVLLVLLAIVLLTTTFIAKGDIKVALAQANSSTSLSVEQETVISIKENNSIFLNNLHISLEALKVEVNKLNKLSHIYIRCDKKADFEAFVSVLDLLKTNRFENISIVTKR